MSGPVVHEDGEGAAHILCVQLDRIPYRDVGERMDGDAQVVEVEFVRGVILGKLQQIDAVH